MHFCFASLVHDEAAEFDEYRNVKFRSVYLSFSLALALFFTRIYISFSFSLVFILLLFLLLPSYDPSISLPKVLNGLQKFPENPSI